MLPVLGEETCHFVSSELRYRSPPVIVHHYNPVLRTDQPPDPFRTRSRRCYSGQCALGVAFVDGDEQSAGGEQAERVDAGGVTDYTSLRENIDSPCINDNSRAGGLRHLVERRGQPALGWIVHGVDRNRLARGQGIGNDADPGLDDVLPRAVNRLSGHSEGQQLRRGLPREYGGALNSDTPG